MVDEGGGAGLLTMEQVACGKPIWATGRLDVGDEPPLKARLQPLLQLCHGLGRPVAGEHQLPVGPIQGVEGVEQPTPVARLLYGTPHLAEKRGL